MLIARLIADAADLETSLQRASDALREEGTPMAASSLLASNEDVLEMTFPDGAPQTVLRVLVDSFTPQAVLVTTREITIPKVFVSDMDSTVIGQECIDELAAYAGIKNEIAQITERAMQGELDFAAALESRVALLAGLPESAIAQCLDEAITDTKGARVLVKTLRKFGTKCTLVTGGFHHFADPIGERIGFDRVVGNRLGVEKTAKAAGEQPMPVLTGTLEGPICDADTKRRVLAEELEPFGAEALSAAIGDGANDIAMIKAADMGLAFRAKKPAREAANGLVEVQDLTLVLSLLGIRERDWEM